ncbi:MAG TPA: alpha/beta hydrolase [Ramlibacter sp.]|uniref:alpha/beta hydrolase n=1 Tax=Ramlibacter sp. TaxID=1917967 RepID=UPI002B932215|nr:alpha/beta hydrolase [Ramlibacter sp.]HVZ46718.1 alpha/beta hydrolase [Ramlibacter sp.]
MDKGYDGAWLDRMYNNRARVADADERMQRWTRDSARVRAEHRCTLDIPYGNAPAERLDVFPAEGRGVPVLVFLHGGYWRALDKSDHSFVAPAFTRDGVCVVVPNYTLCPAATVPQITLETVRAVAWVARNIERFGGDPTRIAVAGHSAGGQLAAMMLACLWPIHDPALDARTVRNSLAISPLHDLEPLMHCPYLQTSLHLTPEHVRLASPARLAAPPGGMLYSVVGGDESEEFLRQNRLICEAWGGERVPLCEALEGLNHFTVLEALVEPAHRLHQLALDLLQN